MELNEVLELISNASDFVLDCFGDAIIVMFIMIFASYVLGALFRHPILKDILGVYLPYLLPIGMTVFNIVMVIIGKASFYSTAASIIVGWGGQILLQNKPILIGVIFGIVSGLSLFGGRYFPAVVYGLMLMLAIFIAGKNRRLVKDENGNLTEADAKQSALSIMIKNGFYFCLSTIVLALAVTTLVLCIINTVDAIKTSGATDPTGYAVVFGILTVSFFSLTYMLTALFNKGRDEKDWIEAQLTNWLGVDSTRTFKRVVLFVALGIYAVLDVIMLVFGIIASGGDWDILGLFLALFLGVPVAGGLVYLYTLFDGHTSIFPKKAFFSVIVSAVDYLFMLCLFGGFVYLARTGVNYIFSGNAVKELSKEETVNLGLIMVVGGIVLFVITFRLFRGLQSEGESYIAFISNIALILLALLAIGNVILCVQDLNAIGDKSDALANVYKGALIAVGLVSLGSGVVFYTNRE